MSAPRIFCIGRNYADHIRELGNAPAADCVVFMKPYTSVVLPGRVPLPRDRGTVHHELELVIEIGLAGAAIPSAHALEHVRAITLGIDLTLRELQNRLRQSGSPWELCKAFDHSALLGELLPWQATTDLQNIDLQLSINGGLRQQGNTATMLFPVPRLIELLSHSWRLLPGDLIYTGTPAGVGPVEPGDHVIVQSPQIGSFSWTFA